MLKLKLKLTFLVIPGVAAYAGPADNLPLKDRIQIGTNAVKLGCGAESKENNVRMDVAADGSITLRKLPSASANGQIHYSSRESTGLLAAFQKEITASGAKLSEKQLDCMSKYVDRIIDTVLPAPKS
jgi:hypothetical protein